LWPQAEANGKFRGQPFHKRRNFPQKKEFCGRTSLEAARPRAIFWPPLRRKPFPDPFSDAGEGAFLPRYPTDTSKEGKSNRFRLSRASSACGTWGKLFQGLGFRPFFAFREGAHEGSLYLKSQTGRKTGPEFRTFFLESGLKAEAAPLRPRRFGLNESEPC